MKKKRIQAVMLALCMALSCSPIAVQAFHKQTPKAFLLRQEQIQADGSWLQAYYTDSGGNPVSETTTDTVRAAEDALPAAYDLRKYGFVTPVHDQGGAASCWAFSMLACVESNYVRHGYGDVQSTDFSEAHLIYFTMRQRIKDKSSPYYNDGVYFERPFLKGTNWRNVANAVINGVGVRQERKNPWIITYDENVFPQMYCDESERFDSDARLLDAQLVYKRPVLYNVTADEAAEAYQSAMLPAIPTIKQNILQYGALAMSYFDDCYGYPGQGSYNRSMDAYYQNKEMFLVNHFVTVVGWDDNYAVSNFRSDCRPSKPGAWLCKNSWGTDFHKDGYFWISYEEPSICEIVCMDTAKADLYEKVYAYDGANTSAYFESMEGTGICANKFTCDGEEYLTHVAVYNPNEIPTDVQISVYTGKPDSAVNPLSGCAMQGSVTEVKNLRYGYKTVALQTPIALHSGDTFTVAVRYEVQADCVHLPVEGPSVRQPAEDDLTYGCKVGQSFICINDEWYDCTNIISDSSVRNWNNVPIKAMTVSAENFDPIAKPTDITIANPARKTQYKVGEAVDTTGLVLQANYADGTSEPVDDFTLSPKVLTQSGNVSLTLTATISGREYKTAYTVQVEAPEPVQMYAQCSQNAIGYRPDGKPDLSCVRICIDYDDGTSGYIDTFTYTAQAQSDGLMRFTLRFTLNGKSYSVVYTAMMEPSEVTGISVSGSTSLVYKNAGKLSASVTTYGSPTYKVTWSSSDPNVVSVDDLGNLRALKKGSATITATATDSAGKSVSQSVQVKVNYVWWQYLILIFLLGFLWY